MPTATSAPGPQMELDLKVFLCKVFIFFQRITFLESKSEEAGWTANSPKKSPQNLPKSSQNRRLGVVLGDLGASGGVLGRREASWGCLGGVLGASWGHLGAVLGASWGVLRSSLAVLGRLGCVLGASGGVLGESWGF